MPFCKSVNCADKKKGVIKNSCIILNCCCPVTVPVANLVIVAPPIWYDKSPKKLIAVTGVEPVG